MSKAYDALVAEVVEEMPAETRQFAQAARQYFALVREQDFGMREQIRARRKALGWSQRRLSREAEVTQADVSRLESGKGNPTLASMAKVAGALGLFLTLLPRDTDNGTADFSVDRETLDETALALDRAADRALSLMKDEHVAQMSEETQRALLALEPLLRSFEESLSALDLGEREAIDAHSPWQLIGRSQSEDPQATSRSVTGRIVSDH